LVTSLALLSALSTPVYAEPRPFLPRSGDLGAFWTPLHAEPIPQSVRLWEQQKHRLPRVEVNGVPLQGLSLCTLVARCHEPQPFLALPSDLGEDTCDLSQVILAYGGWCRAGVEHPTNPHLAPPQLPLVTCVRTDEGVLLLYLNNITKLHWQPTPEGQAKAVEWLSHLPETVEPWSEGIELIPTQWMRDMPPHARP
jgi:hypothetical protein